MSPSIYPYLGKKTSKELHPDHYEKFFSIWFYWYWINFRFYANSFVIHRRKLVYDVNDVNLMKTLL